MKQWLEYWPQRDTEMKYATVALRESIEIKKKLLNDDYLLETIFNVAKEIVQTFQKNGGEKIGGPATEGMASIILEVDADDNIWAVAVLGPQKFQAFFDAFKQDLRKVYGRKGANQLTKVEAKVQPLKNFSAEIS